MVQDEVGDVPPADPVEGGEEIPEVGDSPVDNAEDPQEDQQSVQDESQGHSVGGANGGVPRGQDDNDADAPAATEVDDLNEGVVDVPSPRATDEAAVSPKAVTFVQGPEKKDRKDAMREPVEYDDYGGDVDDDIYFTDSDDEDNDLWVANILVEGATFTESLGCCGKTTYVRLELTVFKPNSNNVETPFKRKFTNFPPLTLAQHRMLNPRRRIRKGEQRADWQGPSPTYNCRFQVPLDNYRDATYRNPQLKVKVFKKGLGICQDAYVGGFIIPLAERYPGPGQQPGEVSDTGVLPHADDGWGGCMVAAERVEGTLRRKGEAVGSITLKRVYFKPSLKRRPAEVAELWKGTRVIPNLNHWGLAFPFEERLPSPGGEEASKPIVRALNYQVTPPPADQSHPLVAKMLGTVVALERNRQLVQVKWDTQPEPMWYRCGRHGAQDVLPLHHTKYREQGKAHVQWNPLDFFQEDQVRHLVYVLKQMHLMVISGINQQRSSDPTPEKDAFMEKLIYRSILPEQGWMILYCLLHETVDNLDKLRRSEVSVAKMSWDDQTGDLKQRMIEGLFDRSFPPKDRYFLLLSAKMIDEETGIGSEPVSVEISMEDSLGKPLKKSDPATLEELHRWKERNVFSEEGLAKLKGDVLHWVKVGSQSYSVKESLDHLLPNLITRLNGTSRIARSAVLNGIFMEDVINDAATMLYRVEKELRIRATLDSSETIEDAKRRCKNDVLKMMAPLVKDELSGSDIDPEGPSWMIRTVQHVEEASLLQTSEAIEDLVGTRPRPSGKEFIENLRSIALQKHKSNLRERVPMLDRFIHWYHRQAWIRQLKVFPRAADKLEGMFGSAIGEYFRFIWYVAVLNFYCFIIWLLLVILPWIHWVRDQPAITIDHEDAWGNLIGLLGDNETEWNRTRAMGQQTVWAPGIGGDPLAPLVSSTTYTNLTSEAMEEGNWFLYGAYPPTTDDVELGAAYTAACFLTLILAFLMIAYEIGRRSRQTPSDISANSHIEMFKAKWTRILKKMERFDSDRLSLVDQIVTQDDDYTPSTIEQIEDSAKAHMVSEESIVNLFSWPVGMNDPQGARLKIEGSRQYWLLKHALMGYQAVEVEDDGTMCSERKKRDYMKYCGWVLSVLIVGGALLALYLVVDEREELNEKNQFLAPLLIGIINGITPAIIRVIVVKMEYYEDPSIAVYNIIGRQFLIKMTNVVFVTLNLQENKVQRCQENYTATMLFQLVFVGVVIEVVVFFVFGLLFQYLNLWYFFPTGIKAIELEKTKLQVPEPLWPTPGSSLKYPITWGLPCCRRPTGDEKKVTYVNDTNLEEREKFCVVSKLVEQFDSPTSQEADQSCTHLLELQELRKPKEEISAAYKIVKEKEAQMHATRQEELLKKTQYLPSLTEEDRLKYLTMRLEIDQDAVFQTFAMTLTEGAEHDFEFRRWKQYCDTLNETRPEVRDTEPVEEPGTPESGERANKWKAMLDPSEVYYPAQAGHSGYHLEDDRDVKWRQKQHLILLNYMGELRPVVRRYLITDQDKNRIKQLDESLRKQVKRIASLQRKLARNYDPKTEDRIWDERAKFRLDLRTRLYLKQKKMYTQRVNGLMEKLNQTRETLPMENGKDEFDMPIEVINFLYMQALIWVGSVFSPMMQFQGFLAGSIWFWCQKLVMERFLIAPRKPLPIGSTSLFFYYLLIATLLVCLIPIASFITDVMTDCGPHIGTKPIDGMWLWVAGWPYTLRRIIWWVFSPFILVTLVVMLCAAVFLLVMRILRLHQEIRTAYADMAGIRAEEREYASFLRRYTQDVQTFVRTHTLLDPDNSPYTQQLQIDEAEGFFGGREAVMLSYTKTFGTTMCSLLKHNPLDRLKDKVLQGDHAQVLKEYKATHRRASVASRKQSYW